MAYDWAEIESELYEDNATFASIRAMARYLGIPYGTVYDAYQRGDLPDYLVQENVDVTVAESKIPGETEQVSWEEEGNEARAKFKSADPLTPEELCALAGVDLSQWKIESHKINVWQMGRKHKKVDMTWTDGVADGWVKDDGDIKKTYLYQTEVRLTRRERIPVKPVMQSIQLPKLGEFETGPAKRIGGRYTTLFIADPHFGFRRTLDDGLVPFQVRHFIGSLLAIAREIQPDEVVWNGDVLDLADWSKFDSEPELLFNTQLAGMELAWVLEKFRRTTDRQVVIEGNHEIRLRKAIIKNFEYAYELRAVHELYKEPMLSVPRFLGLEQLDTEWVEGYPDSNHKMGTVTFSHGSTARKGSGRTAAYLAKAAARSHFFGHNHRHELVRKWVPDIGREIWLGSPGCACDRRVTPGANDTHNWQLGAFVVHQTLGTDRVTVEHIASTIYKDETWFRGQGYAANNYIEKFRRSVPDKFKRGGL